MNHADHGSPAPENPTAFGTLRASLLATCLMAAACAPAGAQTAGPRAPAPEVMPNVYEVSPEHLAAAQEAGPPPFVEVNGNAEVSVPADRARVVFAVETQAATAREAVATNAERMDAVIRALRGAGMAGLEIETSGFQLHPVYSRPSRDQTGAPVIDSYRTTNNVAVVVPEAAAVGRLIDAAVQAGANRVASLRFEASDTEAARQEALRLAVERARSEAQTIATAMGVALGPPLEVRGGAESPSPPPMPFERAMMMDMAQAAPTPVEPGEQTVRAHVTIRYRLGSSTP